MEPTFLRTVKFTGKTHSDADGERADVYAVHVQRPGRSDWYDVYVQPNRFADVGAGLVTASDELIRDFRDSPLLITWICHAVGQHVQEHRGDPVATQASSAST